MTWRKPENGYVISYSYLWANESNAGREEGRKDRPCAIVLTRHDDIKGTRVRVLPVTHLSPADGTPAIEIPAMTKARLGLDSKRSWIILNEVNEFTWPGYDVRTVGNTGSPYYGPLPPDFFNKIIASLRQVRIRITKRT